MINVIKVFLEYPPFRIINITFNHESVLYQLCFDWCESNQYLCHLIVNFNISFHIFP